MRLGSRHRRLLSEPVSVKPVPSDHRMRTLVGTASLVLLLADAAGAAEPGWSSGWVEPLRPRHPLLAKALEQILDPWFFFGMTAQFVFFMRFVVQWIASEKKKRSTVPVSFWYLSLLGSLALFVYALHRWDFVIMAGQFLACGIYIRNLMLISSWRKRRRQAGLPIDDPDDEDGESAVAAHEQGR
jgi:lipid-A-disaccharide synthase-like uncharacterized protein